MHVLVTGSIWRPRVPTTTACTRSPRTTSTARNRCGRSRNEPGQSKVRLAVRIPPLEPWKQVYRETWRLAVQRRQPLLGWLLHGAAVPLWWGRIQSSEWRRLVHGPGRLKRKVRMPDACLVSVIIVSDCWHYHSNNNVIEHSAGFFIQCLGTTTYCLSH